MATATIDVEHSPRTTGRRIALGLATALPCLLALAAVVDLMTGGDARTELVHEAMHVVWLGLLLLLPYALLWRQAPRRVALWQALAVEAVIVDVAGPFAKVSDPVFYVLFPLLAFLAWWTDPDRGRLLQAPSAISPVLAPLAALCAVPAVAYAVDQIALQRTLAADPHGTASHYVGQAVVALALTAFATVASLRTPGWRWAGGLAIAGAGVWGLLSVAVGDRPGSLGTDGGAGLLVAAAAFAAGLVWEHRRG